MVRSFSKADDVQRLDVSNIALASIPEGHIGALNINIRMIHFSATGWSTLRKERPVNNWPRSGEKVRKAWQRNFRNEALTIKDLWKA